MKKSKVYIVIASGEDDRVLIGTYSTLRKAESAAEEVVKYQSRFGFRYRKEIDHYDDGDMTGWYDYNNNRAIYIIESVVE